jgi:hypothetical protein
MKVLIIFLVALSLCACAYKPVPDGYTGQVATIRDTGFRESSTKAQMFVLVEIDGHIIPNSLGESASASQGLGFFVRTLFVRQLRQAIDEFISAQMKRQPPLNGQSVM